MIELTMVAWLAAGLVAGLLHATLLRRATQRLTDWTPVLGMLRLGLVATLLVFAALSGTIVEAASGWAASFAVVIASVVMSRTNRAQATPKARTGARRDTSHAA